MTTFQNKKPSKIVGIQFSILSPQEIQKSSVAEIVNRDTYVNNKPVLGGLFDPRMGVLEPGFICPTDGLDYIQTPGYFGHINLSRPVFYIQYLSTLMKILRCVCVKCSKILIDKEKYSYLLKYNNDERWQKVFTFASKKRRCGEDSHNGCGCLQPKLKKEGLATLIAEWSEKEDDSSGGDKTESKLTMKLLPELVIKILRKISDEDVNFMGFSPIWSRPEWMVCQVVGIPPPAVRPSVKHDAQQRSEDDLTHIIVNIIKANKTLQEKIEQNANPNVIDDWTTVLQYYIATLVDNKIPGVAAVAQRSGRPLKAIKDRLNGKSGRVRGNLMGKRVDFSARSVITPDPNLSISELGVPLKIAKNLTKPITVNSKNKNYLMKFIMNGPDIYPGAKIYEKKNGDCISLRYVDRGSIKLENGDIVHRHVMDGDAVLFNRQPTLHRMSMMCHIAKIMKKGDTFRMNVGDTKPYNADFDGDEMNLHMPQDEESEIELSNLAAVKYNIISPANNKSIVGIFQDSLLSSYLFSRESISFDSRHAMNLLMHCNKIDTASIDFHKTKVSNFDILSQIIPNISLKYKTKRFGDDENINTSNNVLEIRNGKMHRGHIEKGVLGDTTRGLIHRIYNDYQEDACRDFIDDLQNIVTEYMKLNGYSVGISDLIADDNTNSKITQVISQKKMDVKSLIDETHLGIFDNKTGKPNVEEFETRVNNILNKASHEAGKIGRKNLDANNRFVIMVNAGSKGSDLNISQMISCLGQQNVDGKRIPYGFQDRTLPHFSKYDDSPEARGFVESSFIGGLRPEELFFHAMGGRVGLIDTAVKTSQTGYIQRRIIKGLEDLMVTYDMTVRNNKNKVIQFSYGEDGFDPVRVESQQVPFVSMSIEEIYGHYQMPNDSTKDSIYSTLYTKQAYTKFKKQKGDLDGKCKYYIDYIINARKEIVEKIFRKIHKTSVNLPVSFVNIINNVTGNQDENVIVDITPLDVFTLIEDNFKKLESISYCKPNELFKTLYYYYLSPKELLMHKKLTKKSIELVLTIINNAYKKAIVAPGEMVGMIAAQSIGEPTTQLTLNSVTFDTPIIVRNKEGFIKKISIGEFTEFHIKNTKKLEYYKDKDTTYSELNEFYEIPSATEDGKITWNTIEAVTQHPVVNEDGTNTLLKVTTEHGREVIATKAKSFLQLINGKISGAAGKDLKVGDYLPVSRMPIEFTESRTLDLRELFLPNKYVYGSEIAKVKEVLHEHHWWSKHNNKTFIVPYKRSDTLVEKLSSRCRKNCNSTWDYKDGIIYPFPHRGIVKCTIPEVIDLDYDFGYLLGAYAAEGCITKTQISISNIDNAYFEPIQRLAEKYNVSTKIYKHENKGKEGWTSQDIRLYSVMLTRIVETLCGRYSNGKFIHSKILYSNKDCLKGFLDAYIGGDGSINKIQKCINMVSVSKDLIWDVHQILNIFDIYSSVHSMKKCTTDIVFPNYVTPANNIKQPYQLSITNNQAKKLANLLNIKIKHKQEALQLIINNNFKYEYNKNNLNVPNIIDNECVIEPRDNRFENIYFDKIKSIEEVPNPTNYVYDLTVETTRNFNIYNGLCLEDTFHFAGVASKSNVTRGVPRIEEILSLSENPKNPSCTIYLNELDRFDQNKAKEYINNLEHTHLRDLVETCEIYFDPNDSSTVVEEDKDIVNEYNEFEKLLDECSSNYDDTKEKSKWVIRFTMNKIEMLDKNITMEDIHFALTNANSNIICMYNDYNSDNLVFRIRLTKSTMTNKKKKNKLISDSLDQSDEIYLLKNLQDELLNSLVLRGIKNINKVILRKITDNVEEIDMKYVKKEEWVLDTVGTNLLEILSLDFIDYTRTTTNDIIEIYNVLGIEAARQAIFDEFSEVIEFDSTYINYHHLTMLCDRMTCNNKMVSIFRHGINNDNIGPIAKASFEETPEMFLKAAKHGELDIMKGVSSNIMCGQQGYYGTNCFKVLSDIEYMMSINQDNSEDKDEPTNDFMNVDAIESQLNETEDDLYCNIDNLTIHSNVENIKTHTILDDDYEIDF
tara:strand:+ start:890 stop:6949 length:6060 start_codon:yes stop_codon:yes gene_type:complete